MWCVVCGVCVCVYVCLCISRYNTTENFKFNIATCDSHFCVAIGFDIIPPCVECIKFKY